MVLASCLAVVVIIDQFSELRQSGSGEGAGGWVVSQPRAANQPRAACLPSASVRVVVVEPTITLQKSVLVVHPCNSNGVVTRDPFY